MWLPTMWVWVAAMSAPRSSKGGAAKVKDTAEADLYALLDVSPSAEATEIRAAYRRATLSAHPDKGGSSEAFHSIKSAFNVLSCPGSRCLYDQEHSEQLRDAQVSKSRKQKRILSSDSRSLEGVVPAFPNARLAASSRLDAVLHRLRALLQCMDKPSRTTSMSSVPLRVQRSLMDFMKKTPEKVTEVENCAEEHPRRVGSGCTRLNTCGKKSNAQLDIEHLRFYTRWGKLEAAVEHQLLLEKVRHGIIVASKQDQAFWNKPREVGKIFDDVLSQHETSIGEIGLSVYAELRAPELVGSSHRITSPVLPLAEAILMRARLMHARATSWELFRTEWMALLQSGKHGRSFDDAEARVEQARRSFLEQRLSHAVDAVERVLDLQDRLEDKANCRIASMEERRTQKELLASSKALGGKKSRRSLSDCGSENGAATPWPYLSVQRLRAHDQAGEVPRTMAPKGK